MWCHQCAFLSNCCSQLRFIYSTDKHKSNAEILSVFWLDQTVIWNLSLSMRVSINRYMLVRFEEASTAACQTFNLQLIGWFFRCTTSSVSLVTHESGRVQLQVIHARLRTNFECHLPTWFEYSTHAFSQALACFELFISSNV